MLDRISCVWPDAVVLLPMLRECSTIDAFKEYATQLVPSLQLLIKYLTSVVNQTEMFENMDSENIFEQKRTMASRALSNTNQFLSAMWLRLMLLDILHTHPGIPAASELRCVLTGTEQRLRCRHTKSIEMSQAVEQKRLQLEDNVANLPVPKRLCVGTETTLYKVELNSLCCLSKQKTQQFMSAARSCRFDLDGWLFTHTSHEGRPPLPSQRHSTTLGLLEEHEQQQRQAIEDTTVHVWGFFNSIMYAYEQLMRHHMLYRMCVFRGRFDYLEQCIITHHLSYTRYLLDTMLFLADYCIAGHSMGIYTEFRKSIHMFSIALVESID